MFRKIIILIFAALILNVHVIECCADHDSTEHNNHSNIENNSAIEDNSSSESSNKTNEINLANISSHCNESFRITMDYLTELNTTGSFPDESDKTPMVKLQFEII